MKKGFLFTKIWPVMVAVFIALFPKCPVCWAAYLQILGLIGAYKIPYAPWLLYLLLLMALYNIAISFYRSKTTHNYVPFMMQLTGYFCVFINWKYFNNTWLTLAGITGIMLPVLLFNIKPRFALLSAIPAPEENKPCNCARKPVRPFISARLAAEGDGMASF